ncbi:50S ribosomal protein L33 [Rhodococcus hoagii]|nr:50S ribosomal protein L33 [Prescottella equi]NKZ88058.1 50S ribosomal protein L33 [Prescottella equi]
MAGNEIRPLTKLVSTAGTGYRYYTRKNRRNARSVWYCAATTPWCARHVDFREER